VETLANARQIVLDGKPDPTTDGGWSVGEILPIVNKNIGLLLLFSDKFKKTANTGRSPG